MRFAFGEDEVRRIAKAVRAVEQNQGSPKSAKVGPRHTSSYMAIVKVTEVLSPISNGKIFTVDDNTGILAEGENVKIKEINNKTLNLNDYYVGFFSGYSSSLPYFIVSAGGGGSGATIEVVTDVTCTPTGLEVSTATLSGANYDNAVIRQFLSLSDVTPKSYLGNQNRVVRVNSDATGLEFGAITVGTETTWISLVDTPEEYGTTNTYKPVIVSSNNKGLSFGDNEITAVYSLTGGGNPNSPNFISLRLVGDELTPGKNKYYGTDSVTGLRGWKYVNFLQLSDTPESYADSAGKFLTVKSDLTGIEFSENSFISLTDCPTDYTKQAGNIVRVNAAENGLEFYAIDLVQIKSDVEILINANLNNRLTSVEATVSGHTTDIFNLNSDLNTLQTDINNEVTNRTSADNTLDGKILTLQTAVSSNTSSISTINSTITIIQGDISNLNGDISTINNTISTIQSNITTLQSDVSTLQTGLTTAESNIATLQSDVSTIQTNVTTLQGDVSTLQTSMTTAEGNIISLQSDVSALQTSMTAAQGDITTLQTGLTTAEGNISTLQGDVSTLQSDMLNAQNDIEAIDTRVTDIESYITSTSVILGGVQVVGTQQTAVADAVGATIDDTSLANCASSTQTAVDDIKTQLNSVLTALRNHGLIAT